MECAVEDSTDCTCDIGWSVGEDSDASMIVSASVSSKIEMSVTYLQFTNSSEPPIAPMTKLVKSRRQYLSGVSAKGRITVLIRMSMSDVKRTHFGLKREVNGAENNMIGPAGKLPRMSVVDFTIDRDLLHTDESNG